MKTTLKILRLLAILGGAFATTAAFGQTTCVWTGAGDGTNIDAAANWLSNAAPSALSTDTGEFNGTQPGNLNLVYNNGDNGWPGDYQSAGITIYLNTNQTGSVTIGTTRGTSASWAYSGFKIDPGAGALTVGGPDASHILAIVGRPGGAVHPFINNSTNTATLTPWIRWTPGGGAAWTADFSGTGNWQVNSYLNNDGGGANIIQVDGPGTVYWNPQGYFGEMKMGSPFVINSNGTMVLGQPHPGISGQAWTLNGTFIFDALSQSQTLSGVISGSGTLVVTNGTLTLSGSSTYTGMTILNGGELIVNSAENPGVSGPLGVGGTIFFNGGTLGYGTNNAFDYSPRFSTATNQAYSIDTARHDVTFGTALGSSGGTLTKTNVGTLTLAGLSSYSGTTIVSAGKLVFQGSKTGTGDIAVADGATLGVADTGMQITPGTLTLGSGAGCILEFNSVTNTTTAPLAANALSSAGPITININSGTFNVGQSYPLLAWDSGSAPAVTLGFVSGALGNLSTNDNTIQFNVTAATLVWTGINSGNWSDPNNWTTSYFDPLPVLFDDTASGTTSVIVDIPVHPASVRVDNSAKTYSITSVGGNNIGGSTGLSKRNTGPLTLSGGANTYTGPTTLGGGTVSVSTLADGGSPSDIGASDNSTANLVFDGGALRYTGSGVSIDRAFTLGLAGGTIDASGSGALSLAYTGSPGYSGYGRRILTLTGASTAGNTLAAALSDSSLGSPTFLVKSGTGKWILTANDTYSGGTIINGGTLQVGAGGTSGSLGTGNVTNNGALDFNRTNSLTYDGTISGTGAVTVASGTITLTGGNSYTGGTSVSNGATLNIGNGGAGANLATTAPIINNGFMKFNSASPITIGGYFATISGTGNFEIAGTGMVGLLGAKTYTGWTLIDAGATLWVSVGNETTGMSGPPITNNGTLYMQRQDYGIFIITNNIVGSGKLVKDVFGTNPGDVTLYGTNTYTGGTWIQGGGVILGNGFTSGFGSIVGNVYFTNTPVEFASYRYLTFNRPDDFTFSGNIVGAVTDGSSIYQQGSVIQQGTNVVTLTGNNTYAGGTIINSGTLQVGNGGTSGSPGSGSVTDDGTLIFNRSDNVAWNNSVSGMGSLVKLGPGTLTLTADNTYSAATTVNAGTLFINGSNAAALTTVNAGALGGTGTLSGPVTVNAGTTLAPGPSIASIGTFTINNDLSLGGNLAIEVNKLLSPSNDFVVVTGTLTNSGMGTVIVTNLGPALAVGDKFTLFSKPLQNGAAMTVTGAGATWTNNLAVDGSIAVTAVSRPALNFALTGGNSLQFSWDTSLGSFKLQAQTNRLNVGLGTNWVDYPGGDTSGITVPIDATNGTVFFRLVSP